MDDVRVWIERLMARDVIECMACHVPNMYFGKLYYLIEIYVLSGTIRLHVVL